MKNISKLLVACACLLLLADSAMAFGQILYPDRPLNLRSGRSARAKWVGSLYPGQKVRVAFEKDGWVAVFEPGETRGSESAAVGYSNAKYLLPKPTRVEPKPWGELVYTVRNLNIRDKASVKGERLDMLKKGERVKIDFPDGDWTMVFSPAATIRSEMNGIGYCSAKYFKPVPRSEARAAALAATKAASAPEPAPAPAPEPPAEEPAPKVSAVVEAGSGAGQVGSAVAPPPPAPEKAVADNSWGRVVTVDRVINVYKGRTSGSKPVHTLKPGQSVRVDFLDRGWYAVFPENAVVRQESRAMGYALRSLIDGEDGSDVIPAPAPRYEAPAPEPAKAEPSPKAAAAGDEVPAPTAKADESGRKTIVIDRSRLSGTKRADPTPDKNVHGYQYRLLEKSETKRYGETWVTLKIFLATKTLPGMEALEDFSATLWKEHKRSGKNLAVLIYLPGMDTEDLSYAVLQFSDEKLLEVWVRKTTLFGTDFL